MTNEEQQHMNSLISEYGQASEALGECDGGRYWNGLYSTQNKALTALKSYIQLMTKNKSNE